MISEKGLAIIEKLISHNHEAVTAKSLATSTGMSERSVKTYIKEVADFCDENHMTLSRKPGKGIKPDFTDEQIERLQHEIGSKSHAATKKERRNYIAYILLSGWDTYTYALFSDELYVSKNVIVDDINELGLEMEAFGVSIHKTAGYGIYVSGREMDIRRALRHFCRYPISDKQIIKEYDHRLSVVDCENIANNFRSVNLNMAVEVIHAVEKEFDVIFTDYVFLMLAEYITIGLFRVDVDKCIDSSVDEHTLFVEMADAAAESDTSIFANMSNATTRVDASIFTEMADAAASYLRKDHNIKLDDGEIYYLAMLFSCSETQNKALVFDEESKQIEEEIVVYLSNLLASNLFDNDLLRDSMKSFIPGSIARTRYGIEIANPFLQEITESYGSLFTVCFTVSRFYEKYTGKLPSQDEIAFIALQVGGALHRNPMTVRAVLIGASGFAACHIIAGKIENRVPDVHIVSILTSDKIDEAYNYDCDLILCAANTNRELQKDERFLRISPLVSEKDEKNIRDKCFKLMTGQSVELGVFSEMLDDDCVIFEKKAGGRRAILEKACRLLLKKGYVDDTFEHTVLEREKIESTSVGYGIAIPHGKPENVISPKIAAVRLDKPIDWGSAKVDLIFVLAIKFDSVNTTKAFFHDFTKLLDSKTVEKLHAAKTETEFNNVIRERTGWH